MSSDRHNSRSSRPWQPLKRLMQGLFRFLVHLTGRRRSPQAGFVFPTTLLLVLMVLLTASALTFRTFTRSTQNIGQRDQQVIYNSATPAVDRAKAKIEFMFQEDPRFPSGVPPSDFLADMMAVEHDPANGYVGFSNSRPVPPLTPKDTSATVTNYDPYTFPDEERVDINDDGNLDNAWAFVSSGELVVYSVLVDDTYFENDDGGSAAVKDLDPDPDDPDVDDPVVELSDPANDMKAEALVTRTGPLATTEATDACQGAVAEEGWQIVQNADNSSLQKNFQVDVFVADSDGATNTFETLEFQQSRIAARSNKWGAWFRYDLEIFPGSSFNWNGAMHTDGSISLTGGVEPHMVSSHNSCLYSKRSSEITLGEFDNNGDGVINVADGDFQGQAIKGFVETDAYEGGDISIHLWDQNDNTKPLTNGTSDFNSGNDSVTGGSPSEIAMNFMKLFTEDIAEHTDVDNWNRDGDWNEDDSEFVARGRILNDQVSRPFVDDFYRADNRWGPKPRYDSRDSSLDIVNNPGVVAGDPITGEVKLTDPEDGLDGFWERQAINKGLRIIVGQRLELGNVNGWNNDPSGVSPNPEDPLYPPAQSASALSVNGRFGGNHEYLQRRKLRDNLAAVQGMVAYHYQINDGTFPAACVALTAHPGTEQTIINSRTFDSSPADSSRIRADFLTGRGTNGWEFRFPDDYDTEPEFATALGANQPLGKALRNWAYFAGDPLGGAPSFKAEQNTDVHPAPYLSMWGDVSLLRRIFTDYLDNSVSYADLSLADQATLHSAACTISLLAYNLETAYQESRDVTATITNGYLTSNGQAIQRLLDNKSNGGNAEITDIYYTATFDDGSDNPFYDTSKGANMAQVYANWVDPNPASEVLDVTNSVDANADGDYDDVGDTRAYICHPTETGAIVDDAGYDPDCDIGEFAEQFSFEEWVAAFRLALGDADAAILEETMRAISTGVSSLRDRAMGFSDANYPSGLFAGTGAIAYDKNTGYSAATNINVDGASNSSVALKSSCNPDDVLGAIGGGGNGASARDAIVLSVAICGNDLPVKYPSLYYLFPLEDHDHDGGLSTGGTYDHTQPVGEPYIADTYVVSNNSGADRYKVIDSTTPAELSAIAAEPALADPTLSEWVLPATTSATPLTDPDAPNSAQAFRITTPTGSSIDGIDVPFLDKGIANGRQQMAVRVLDIDVDKLVGTDKPGTDYWLSADLDEQAEGIIYAYREDAVREDEIVRPANTGVQPYDSAGTDCTAPSANGYPFVIETASECQMNAAPGAEQDPPLTPLGISLKPVDFAPDPMRSPDGFRFRASSGNAIDFSGPSLDRQVGMTFVTDNAAYIQGNFNVHSTDGTINNIIEEFDETLLDDSVGYGNAFYDDRFTKNLDSFANLGQDHWRPVEILADEIDLLSGEFLDGAIMDAFTEAEPGGNGQGTSSFMNLYRPRFTGGDRAPGYYVLENPDDPNSSVYIDRNATFYVSEATNTPYYNHPDFDNNNEWVRRADEGTNRGHRHLQRPPADTYMNAVFVSGIVPQRPEQSYGGLHNFPRFSEEWNNRDLFIQGSFIQLNFSTAGTAPFDHDAWEPTDGTSPGNNGEWIGYYRPPNRRWGFDVGLLYVPPAPAARRFVSIGVPRNEYYREIAGDDPYIKNLRCAEDEDGNKLYPNFCNKP